VPSVSVVIPTLRRPVALTRAIESVLGQTFQDFEIVVVIDGPDRETVPGALKAIDPRIRVAALEANVGLAEARNVGVNLAEGRWIALLDDDDVWLPEKLELQVAKAIDAGGEYVFVPCKFIEKTGQMERVMPAKLPSTPENFSEYIYCREGYLQPSMFFMSRALCLEVPFTKGLRHVEDADWLLRAMRHPQVEIAAVDRPLSIYYNLDGGKRESDVRSWQHPLRWAVENHELFTRRSFPFYVARIGVHARKAGEPLGVLWQLVMTARRFGRINAKVMSYFLAYWFLPERTLRRLRGVFR
jgi:glycosyltransferase involved in cell wall biosynthesis